MASSTALIVIPDTELEFVLTRGTSGADASPKATLTLRHPGTTDEHLAFKVKTTQPRRYLVRPNQGLVAPGSSEVVTILLVEKDKQVLLQSYDRLGQHALDHSKDKFLVQSVAVSKDFSTQYTQDKARGATKELSDALTSVWNALSSSGTANIANKKLQVKLTVGDSTTATTAGATTATSRGVPQRHDTPMATIENMTPDQIMQEITTLRRKYDELVAFSVNLTAERDILNNTLEQTKRDLNRQVAAAGGAAAALGEGGGGYGAGGAGGRRGAKKAATSLGGMLPLLLVAFAGFLAGIKMTTNHQVAFVESIPIIGPMVLSPSKEATTTKTGNDESTE